MIHTILESCGIYAWRDLIEIAFISAIIYYFLLWLRQDTHKNLVFAFYGYCLVAFGAYYSSFFTISSILCASTPVIVLLFIILHQQTLQKNFVVLKQARPVNTAASHWFDELVKSCLSALNNNKEFIAVIERTDKLAELIDAECICNADIKKDIIDILLEKQAAHTMLWFNHTGKLVSLNATWRKTNQAAWVSYQAQLLPLWIQDALFITSKLDALVFKINPLTRTCDLVIQGKLIENINPQQAFALLQKQLAIPVKKEVKADFSTAYKIPIKEQRPTL